MALEREIKLIADAGFSMPDLEAVCPGVSIGAVRQASLDSVYYDTPDLSLARSGLTLRSRTGEEAPIWTLKFASSARDGALARVERTFDEPLGPIPHEARLAVRAHVRSQTLSPVLHLRTDRTETCVDHDGELLLKLCDDKVTADVGTEPGKTFREIELEVAGDRATKVAIEQIVTTLRDSGCHRDPPTPKAFRALGARALQPPDVNPGSVGRGTTTGVLVGHVIAKSVRQLVDHHPGAALGDDPEDVHRLRVATRRLRSDLKTFERLLDQHWTAWLRDELKWLGGEVGRGRDADVLAERLRSQMQTLPADDHDAVERLRRRLTAHSSEARTHVIAALESDRYVTLLDALVVATRHPKFAVDAADLVEQPARQVLTTLLRKPWRKLRRAGDGLSDDAPDTAFHAVRIRAKGVRYAAEAVAPVYGKQARRFAEAVAAVQTVLGDHQDTVVAEGWLRAAATDERAARLVIGELLTLERLDRLRLRDEFASVWKKASKRGLRTWFD